MKCLELQELFALEALGALDRVAQSRLNALLADDPDAATEGPGWHDAVAAFASAAVPRRRPPAHLRERILTRIGRTPQLRPRAAPIPSPSPSPSPSPLPPQAVTGSPVLLGPNPAPPRPPMSFSFGATAEWTAMPGVEGIRIRVLSINESQGYRVLQAELDPGAVFPAHHHGAGPEDLFVLSGDLLTEGRTLGPGDHFHAEPGTDHRRLVSPNGCQAIVVEPLKGAEFVVAMV